MTLMDLAMEMDADEALRRTEFCHRRCRFSGAEEKRVGEELCHLRWTLMKLCAGRTSVIDVAASVAQKRSELARNSVIDVIASMVRDRSTVVFYYSSSDRFTTTDPSLGR
ncbi:hypothetical protein F2Q70_00012766 [Brassica cretica]|uniref:Uncharacterized protein n=3 Tax=Brassica TaxID=3705 RepID=A0A8S9M6B1_BRACR|nr:hypothetical protein F2Q70_00012766 [Brassica cretica]